MKPESWRAIFEPVAAEQRAPHPYGFGWDVSGSPVRMSRATAAPGRVSRPTSRATWATTSRSSRSRISPGAARAHRRTHRRPLHSKAARDGDAGRSSARRSPTAPARRCGASTCASRATRSARSARITPRPDDRIVDAHRPGARARLHRRAQPLDRGPRQPIRTRSRRCRRASRRCSSGQDGSSPFPIRDYLASGAAIAARSMSRVLVGHATIRQQVMGNDFRRAGDAPPKSRGWRRSSTRRCARARSACRRASSTKSAATRRPRKWSRWRASPRGTGGFYISHIRDEADSTIEAIREAIAIGEKAQAAGADHAHQARHRRRLGQGRRGRGARSRRPRKRGVDVTADAYPYLAWQSNIKVLVPNKQWTDPASVKEALDDVGGGRNVQITRLPKFPQYVGKRLDEIAKAEGISEVDALHPDRAGRRCRHDRAHDGRRGHAGVLPAAVGDGGQRRRHQQQPSARRRHVSARARPLRARGEMADAARRDPQDDVAAGGATRLEGSRDDRASG